MVNAFAELLQRLSDCLFSTDKAAFRLVKKRRSDNAKVSTGLLSQKTDCRSAETSAQRPSTGDRA